MPFLRFSRDKRGYESIYLMHAETNRRGKTRPRILYWFRTPPGLKVGRPPFDAAAQRAIEAQNPGVVFDWPKIIATPMPPPTPDIERWRERRRQERAAKQAARAEAAGATPPLSPTEGSEEAPEEIAESLAADVIETEDGPETASAPADTSTAEAAPRASEGEGAPGRRRRRRRRGRGQRPAGPPSGSSE